MDAAQLKDYTPAEKVEDLWYQTRKKVQDLREELPAGVIGPFFNDEFGDVYSGLFAITGEEFTMSELKRLAETARQRLIRLPDVDKVAVLAAQDEKVYVEFSHAKLASLGIAPQAIFDSLAKQNAIQSAGSVDTPTDRVFLRVEGPSMPWNKFAMYPCMQEEKSCGLATSPKSVAVMKSLQPIRCDSMVRLP